jgi:tRNA C32,U32 (ribose-2'-O)-methylase TrmJ
MRGGLALVVGSEGRGISGPVRRRLDLSVRIPMRGKIGSLNAAVAGSILLFAIADQRPLPAAPTEAAEKDPAEPSTAEPIAEERPATAEPSGTADAQPEPAPKPKRTRRTTRADTPSAEPPAGETESPELLPGDN